jgi:hypothetical protein
VSIRFSSLSPDEFGVIRESNVRIIRQSDIACPFSIIVADHYREDGSCRCNDPEYREMMKAEWEYTDEAFREAGLI